MTRPMKDSGIEWIGDIPENWGVMFAFQCFEPVKSRNLGTAETNLLSLSYGKIKRKSIETTEGLLPESFETYNVIEKDDIVLRLTDLQNDHKSLRVGLSNEKGIITSAYTTLRNKSVNNPRYLYYYLHSFDIAKGFYGMGAGVRQGLNWEELKHLSILSPDRIEQDNIVVFLDGCCSTIDCIIEKTRSSIEEYKTLRQAIITQAVTKGVRGERPMKDSGIEWIGEIPAEWDVELLKYSIRWKSVKGQPDATVLSLYRDYGVIPKDSRDDNYNVTSLDTGSYKVVNKGDFVINKMKAWQGSMAVSECDGIVSPAYHVCEITNNRIFKKYFHYLLRNQQYLPEYLRLSTGMRIGQWDLGFDDFKNIPFIIPSYAEQQEIAEYIDEKCSEIDNLILYKEQLVAQIENYKQSLIYECVTGKKEVKA